MSGPRPARHFGWKLGRAGCGACVAGAHLAVPSFDGRDVNPRLVPRILPWGPVEFFVASQGQHRLGLVNNAISGALVSKVYWFTWSEPNLRLSL